MDFPSEDTLRWIVARYAHLRAAFGAAVTSAELIEPNGKYFPDAFAHEPESVRRLLKRTMSYSPLADDIDVELGFVEPEGESGGGGGGCGSGACGPGSKSAGAKKTLGSGSVVERPGGAYGVLLQVADVANPVVLTSGLTRAVGGMLLLEAEVDVDDDEVGPVSEMAAVTSGLGVLLLNGACLYMKGCSGLRAHQATHLGVPELAVATALFCRVHGIRPGTVKTHLEVTQAEAFDEALRWVDSNDEIVAKLRETPELLADGLFAIEPTKGLLGRLFTRRRETPALSATPRKPKVRSEAETKRLAETRALVEEALKGG